MCFAPQRRALFRHFFDIWTSKSGPRPSVFNTFDLEMCFAPQRRALFRHRNFKKWSENGVFVTFWLGNVLRATTACTFSTSQLQKVVREWCVLYILTWKCASRHNGVHFFDIATSKSGPRMVCFVHFDLEMCFAPQRRALFRHRNFKKWSENGVFCTFWLGNVLRATTACTFSSLIWPAGSAPAALASLLFDPPEPQIIGKTQWIATFSVSRRSYLFAHLHLLSSDSSHLCFSTVHIVGSFTSKLPSIIVIWSDERLFISSTVVMGIVGNNQISFIMYIYIYIICIYNLLHSHRICVFPILQLNSNATPHRTCPHFVLICLLPIWPISYYFVYWKVVFFLPQRVPPTNGGDPWEMV